MIRVKTPHIRHKRLKGCLTTLSRFCCLSPAIGPKDPRPLASRTTPISPGRDETLQRHEVDKRDSDNRASSWVMSMVYKTLSIRHRLDTARVQSTSSDASARSYTSYTSTIQDVFSTIAISIQIKLSEGCHLRKSSASTSTLSPLRSSTRRRAVMESSTCDL
jgi:hypothetical protein